MIEPVLKYDEVKGGRYDRVLSNNIQIKKK